MLLNNTLGNCLPTNFVNGDVNIVLAPSASNVAVAGRVENAAGVSVNKARVTLMGSDGVARTAMTNAFGNFSIVNVPAGSTYVLSVAAKGYTFVPQTLMVEDDLAKLSLILDQ